MNTRKMVLSAMFFAIGIVLPFVTMQIPMIGNMLLPMHIPVLLCGFVCGAPYGALIGVLLPWCRYLLFGQPILMNAICMSVELMVYGLVFGFFGGKWRSKQSGVIYALFAAMVLGRTVWGATAFVVYSLFNTPFTLRIFLLQSFIYAIPGIFLQLFIIPVIIDKFEKYTKGLNK